MVSFLDVCRRASTGPIASPDDFDLLRFVPTLQRVMARHGVREAEVRTVVPEDDDLADRVFRAARDLVIECGHLCPDTHRVITFTPDEVEESIALAPGEARFGEGKEAGVFRARRPEDPAPPWCHVILVGGGPVTETFAKEIGADAYGRTAREGVDLALGLTAPRRPRGP